VIGEHGISRGVRLIKSIACELLHQVEYFGDNILRIAFGCGAGDKALALLGHFFKVLLAHGAAQQVGLSERVAGDRVRDLHHLLLVDDDAERLLENGLHRR
jgi:hypothetical protein